MHDDGRSFLQESELASSMVTREKDQMERKRRKERKERRRRRRRKRRKEMEEEEDVRSPDVRSPMHLVV